LDLYIVKTTADKTFSGVNCVGGVGDCLTFGWQADEAFALFGESYDRWGGALSFCILNNLGDLFG
jgi:hypothetical protein